MERNKKVPRKGFYCGPRDYKRGESLKEELQTLKGWKHSRSAVYNNCSQKLAKNNKLKPKYDQEIVKFYKLLQLSIFQYLLRWKTFWR